MKNHQLDMLDKMLVVAGNKDELLLLIAKQRQDLLIDLNVAEAAKEVKAEREPAKPKAKRTPEKVPANTTYPELPMERAPSAREAPFYSCPTCGAPPHRRCISVRDGAGRNGPPVGEPLKGYHMARKDLARQHVVSTASALTRVTTTTKVPPMVTHQVINGPAQASVAQSGRWRPAGDDR